MASLRALDGHGYKAYKEVAGSYRATGLLFHVEHVQGDPFADPTRVRVEVDADAAALPAWALRTPTRRRATADYLNRRLFRAAAGRARPGGSGTSGGLFVLEPGQQVLDRTSLMVGADGVVNARFRIGLPARGRRILGQEAANLVAAAVGAAADSLFRPALDLPALQRHVEVVEDAQVLRSQLPGLGLVAFVADGAHLPRRSGVDDRPLAASAVVPFSAPASLRRTLEAPNAGSVSGLGIREGVTLIAGGGYHGKSTLLRALAMGVYDHVPGDGRERVVTVPAAVKVRAEDGRRVAGTDISNLIGTLPDGTDTAAFRSENASGSTSQAAAIVEALEAGASALLMDEDTSASNLMIRDARMQRLIAEGDEPITPFIDRVRPLYETAGVSTVIALGGSGDYFDVADTILTMRAYRPEDMTDAARAVASDLPTFRREMGGSWQPVRDRRPLPDSIDPRRGHRDTAIRILARDRVAFGSELVDLAALEQLVEDAQTRALAYAAARARFEAMDGTRTMGEAVAKAMAEIEQDGLGVVHPHAIGELAWFRGIELAAFLNRLRSLRTESIDLPHPSGR